MNLRKAGVTGVALLCGVAMGCSDTPTSQVASTTATTDTNVSTGTASTPAVTTGATVTTATATATQTSSTGPGMSSSSTGGDNPDAPWQPGTALPTLPDPNPRGLLDLRGLIHTHSPRSHDACDGTPLDKNGEIDPVCFDDLRRGLCGTRHDFVMLTDHADSFADTEFPDVLLYDESRGDILLERGGDPVANWAACESVAPVLIMAGTETGMMPVGLERHIPGRDYGAVGPDAVANFQDHGAITLLPHTEDYTPEQILDLGAHGFEMYNVHANLIDNLVVALQLIGLAEGGGEGLPHSNLLLLPIWREDQAYLSTWGTLFSQGHKRVTTMATDSHRNALPQLLPDGERIDSFERLMGWFSNHLLVEGNPDGTFDDAQIKNALAARQLYGVFEYLGYAEGFDAYIETGDGSFEIGNAVPFSEAPEIFVQTPHVRQLDPDATPPVVTAHILRAIEGGFEEVASGMGDFSYVPDAIGAYRVEIRIVPLHLSEYAGNFVDLTEQSRVWIYANAFFVE